GRHFLGNKPVAGAVIGLCAIEIGLHQAPAGDLAFADRPMHVRDRRLKEMKWRRQRLRIDRSAASAEGARDGDDNQTCPGERHGTPLVGPSGGSEHLHHAPAYASPALPSSAAIARAETSAAGDRMTGPLNCDCGTSCTRSW